MTENIFRSDRATKLQLKTSSTVLVSLWQEGVGEGGSRGLTLQGEAVCLKQLFHRTSVDSVRAAPSAFGEYKKKAESMKRSPETVRLETLQTRTALLRGNTDKSTSEQRAKGTREKEQGKGKKERQTRSGSLGDCARRRTRGQESEWEVEKQMI